MLSLFFVPELPSASTITVSGDEAHHAVNVVRLKVGNRALLSDGVGKWAEVEVVATTKKSFQALVVNSGYEPVQTPRLTVVQALTKSDRTKEMLELLVEAGVDQIIPWAASRSISKWQQDSAAKWQNAALTAAKQSRRFHIPAIGQLVSTEEISGENIFVLHESATSHFSQEITSILADTSEITLVIGPEGGISDAELAILAASGARSIRMGLPVFRSAHAGVAALSALQALLGKW